MKVSFIIVTSSTKKFVEYDSKSWPERNTELEVKLNLQTNKLISQILTLPLDKEIIVVDNTGDFILTKNDSRVKIVEGYGIVYKKDGFLKDFSYITDIVPGYNHTVSCSMSFNIGLKHATGDYIIMQHNDTNYLFDYYGSNKMVNDAIELLEYKKYEYVTVDKKPPKDTSPKGIEYFADCYWFLCKKDFYEKHGIWVDWERGDTNHLATLTCVEKKLPFLHLPGFYELDSSFEGKAWRAYALQKGLNSNTNIHYLNRKPFLEHYKGGTGLSKVIKEQSLDESKADNI